VPKQELDLFEITAGFATELRASPSQVVSAKALDSDFLGGLLNH
jgi:hypothetical protein